MPRKILADGHTYIVPDDATDEEVNQIVGPSKTASAGAGLPAGTRPAGMPAGVDLPGLPSPAAPAVKMPPKTAMDRFAGVDSLSDTGAVVGRHLKSIVSTPYHAFTDAPTDQEQIQEAATGPMGANPISRGIQRMLVKPTQDAITDAVKLRRAGGPQASLTAPSSYDAEDNNVPTAGSKLIDAIPLYGPWSRNYADEVHKDGFLPATAGLATDVLAPKAAGWGAAKALNKVAPVVAEAAMKVRGTDRGYGRTPGQAILDETTGIKPGTIASQAKDKVWKYTSDLDSEAKASTTPFDTQPARDVAAKWEGTALKRNNPETLRDVRKIGSQLSDREGVPIPRMVSADEGLALKRGVQDIPDNFNPATPKDFATRAANATVAEFHPGLERAIPGYKQLNSKISSLLPAAERAGATDLNAGLLQRVMGRFAAPTGALAGGLAGFHYGGLPGAVAGVVGPELLTNPTTLMGIARLAKGGAATMAPAAKAATAAATSQYGRYQPQKQ